jgi:hypothetical protein
MQIEEQYQNDFVEVELAEKKKFLELKRNMMNVVPGGQMQEVLQEHQRNYRQGNRIATLELKRKSEKLAWREH